MCVMFNYIMNGLYMYHHLTVMLNSGFLEIFRLTAYAIFVVFLGSRDGTAWRHYSTHQATLGNYPSFWVWVELPGGDDQPPSDANLVSHVLVFHGFWVNSDWRES